MRVDKASAQEETTYWVAERRYLKKVTEDLQPRIVIDLSWRRTKVKEDTPRFVKGERRPMPLCAGGSTSQGRTGKECWAFGMASRVSTCESVAQGSGCHSSELTSRRDVCRMKIRASSPLQTGKWPSDSPTAGFQHTMHQVSPKMLEKGCEVYNTITSSVLEQYVCGFLVSQNVYDQFTVEEPIQYKQMTWTQVMKMNMKKDIPHWLIPDLFKHKIYNQSATFQLVKFSSEQLSTCDKSRDECLDGSNYISITSVEYRCNSVGFRLWR